MSDQVSLDDYGASPGPIDVDEGLQLGPVGIEGDGDLAKVCDEIEHLLLQTSAPVYQRGGMLVRVIDQAGSIRGLQRDPGAPRIVPFDDLSLADVINRHIHVRKRNRKTGEAARVDCPRGVAQTILARKEWRFRRLEAVVEHPIMLLDGSILWQSGYHEPTGLLLQLPFAEFQSPLEQPTDHEIHAALELLRSLLEGFDFVDELDESVALAFMLTSFVRPVLPTCPAFAIDAHAPGSGKSTLVRMQARLATGREPAFLTLSEDAVEMQKLLFAALLEGDQSIAIDNIVIALQSAVLAIMLTAPVYRARILGLSQNASVPTKAVISLNGNNLQIVGDLTRRVLISRLDPQCERPAERTFGFDPVREVGEARSEYVAAALTIMAGYIAGGERVSVRPFGSFEDWSRAVREPLVWLGLPDPVDSIRLLEAADPERAQLGAMLQCVHDAFASDEFKAAELVAAVRSGRDHHQATIDGGRAPLSDAQAEGLQEALRSVCERNGELNVKALGRWLLRVQGRVLDGLRFMQSRQTKAGSMWRAHRA
ncbi:MAG TPA: hypothetical protein VGI48_09515 [Caldimonas sp.]